MTAGGSATERAAAARRVAVRREREAATAARVADAWEAGSIGEERLASTMTDLAIDGYTALHDRSVPGSRANIDHLLVGPAGVIVLDAKAWTGELETTATSVRQNGRDRTGVISTAHTYATAVAESLASSFTDPKVDVYPGVCFVGEAQLAEPITIDRVRLLNGDGLGDWVRRARPGRPRLDEKRVVEVVHHLSDSFPAKSAEIVAVPTAEAPPELLVYLFPWRKYGKHRLYVRSNDGHDVGYLDLVSGQVSSPSAEWEHVLLQILPHYVFGDSPHSQDLSAEAQGVLRRILEVFRRRTAEVDRGRPILACYRWRKHGKDRLYLNRLEPGGTKSEMGFFDLDTGMVKGMGAGSTSVLGYCGQRFQQLELGSPRAT